MTIDVRDVSIDDARAIVDILNPIIETGLYSALDTPLSVEDERHFIQTFSPRGVFHVAIDRARRGGPRAPDPSGLVTALRLGAVLALPAAPHRHQRTMP